MLGGTSYAAITLPKNSVGPKQIKPGAVKTSELARRSVTSQKVKDGSLMVGDFKAGQLPAGPQGATGPRGATGPSGAAGAPGAPGVSGYEVVQQQRSSTNTFDRLFVECPSGKRVTGGGAAVTPVSKATLAVSEPSQPGNGWGATYTKTAAASAADELTLVVRAICMNVTP